MSVTQEGSNLMHHTGGFLVSSVCLNFTAVTQSSLQNHLSMSLVLKEQLQAWTDTQDGDIIKTNIAMIYSVILFCNTLHLCYAGDSTGSVLFSLRKMIKGSGGFR